MTAVIGQPGTAGTVTIQKENFIVHSGDAFELRYTVEAPEGSTLDDCIIRWRAAKTPDAPAKIERTSVDGVGIQILDSVARTFLVTVPGEATEAMRGAYYHEAEVTDADGNVSTVTTGTMTVKPALIR